jgi:polyhydroxyalkanoate synthesis repressor PhaR
MAAVVVVKKYPNRRLYDTSESRYITLEDLTARIRRGKNVQVLDAQTGTDLTQATLTQIILESRGGAKLLPVPLLVRLIRLDDEALAEFMGRYVTWALEMYLQAKRRARAILPLNPLATAPFAATDALARLVLGAAQQLRGAAGGHAATPVGSAAGGLDAEPPIDMEMPPPPPEVEPGPTDAFPDLTADESSEDASGMRGEVESLRRELDALKAAMGGAPDVPRSRPRLPARRRPTK